MFREEHIDRLKREIESRDFRVPYIGGSAILKGIESTFVVKDNTNDRLSNWGGRIKNKHKIGTVRFAEFETELDKLNPQENYWLVLSDIRPTTKNLVYDCKLHVMPNLVRLHGADFFLVEKKYRWLVYFKRDESTLDIFKSGPALSPWG